MQSPNKVMSAVITVIRVTTKVVKCNNIQYYVDSLFLIYMKYHLYKIYVKTKTESYVTDCFSFYFVVHHSIPCTR